MDEATPVIAAPVVYWTPKRSAIATLVVSAVAGTVVLVCQFRHVVILLLLAVVLATALKPSVEWLNRRGVRWTLAVNGLFAFLFLAIVATAFLAGPSVVREGGEFLNSLPSKYDSLVARLRAIHPLGMSLSQLMPERLPGFWQSLPADDAEPTGGAAIARVSQLVIQMIVSVIAVCILSGYWLLQEQRTIQALLLALPAQRRAEAKSLIEAIENKLGAYVRGQFLLCLIVGLLSVCAYWLIGLPQPVLLAAIAGMFEALPMIGPILGSIPALIVAAATDPSKLFGVVAATIVIQQVENYLLVPRIMDRAVGIHGFVTVLAMAGFGALFGLAGAILAIPLAAIVQLLIDRYVLNREVHTRPAPEGRDRASRLRFELRSLVQDVRMFVRHKPKGGLEDRDELEDAIEAMALELDRQLDTEANVAGPEAASCAAGNS